MQALHQSAEFVALCSLEAQLLGDGTQLTLQTARVILRLAYQPLNLRVQLLKHPSTAYNWLLLIIMGQFLILSILIQIHILAKPIPHSDSVLFTYMKMNKEYSNNVKETPPKSPFGRLQSSMCVIEKSQLKISELFCTCFMKWYSQ